MKREAIYHRMLSEMAYAIDENAITIRIRTAKDDISRITLLYGDRSSRMDPIPLLPIEMERIAFDLYNDYFEATFNSKYSRICYCFEIEDISGTVIYYSGDQFEEAPPAARSEYFQIPYNHRADRMEIPGWMENSIVYNIFPDSFASSRSFINNEGTEIQEDGISIKSLHGGTIKGIESNVDYFKELGVNAIYLNPIFKAGEYHKYDTIDYFKIDPAFGSNGDFHSLVGTLHENNIKIIIDGVFNHCGWHFPPFVDAVEKGKASRYWLWFYRLTEPVIIHSTCDEYPNYECFGYERMMPKLALDNKEVADYFCSVGKYWVEEFDVDGWRLDVADELPDEFWRRFRKEIKTIKPECALIGEVWVNSKHWLDGSMFDSTMNYDVWRHSKRFFAVKDISAMEFNARITDMLMRYSFGYVCAQMNLLDSHDVSRFLSLCNDDYKAYRLAIVFLFTFVGMPMVFYGDERSMKGIEESDFRAPMDWKGEKGSIFSLFQRLIELRREHKELCSGHFRTLCASEDGFFVYERVSSKETMKIALNRNDYPCDYSCGKIIFQEGYKDGFLEPFGFVIHR